MESEPPLIFRSFVALFYISFAQFFADSSFIEFTKKFPIMGSLYGLDNNGEQIDSCRKSDEEGLIGAS